MFEKYKDTQNSDAYIIAEVGQNHQGELDLAIEYINIFASEGADAIKFQTRDNKYLFAKEAYEKNMRVKMLLQMFMESTGNY